jgi:hypothetical protein
MGRGEEEALEGVGTAEVEEEQAFEVDGANLLNDVVGESGEREGEEVGGGWYGDLVKIVLGCECVDLERWRGGMGEKKGEQRSGRGDVRGKVNTVSLEREDGGWECGYARRIMGARHVVDGVQDDVKDLGGFRDRDDCLGVMGHGFSREEVVEWVLGGGEQDMRMYVEEYRIGG